MRRLIAISLALLVFGLPVTALAQESGDGVITGQIINGTEGGGGVSGGEGAVGGGGRCRGGTGADTGATVPDGGVLI